jgi:hypothetical protein
LNAHILSSEQISDALSIGHCIRNKKEFDNGKRIDFDELGVKSGFIRF